MQAADKRLSLSLWRGSDSTERVCSAARFRGADPPAVTASGAQADLHITCGHHSSHHARAWAGGALPPVPSAAPVPARGHRGEPPFSREPALAPGYKDAFLLQTIASSKSLGHLAAVYRG